uniref:Chorein N-terminal domain-containing protein n=1 Tax=Romanomermis culicivorax TaxID=13658 RepID=A0A915J0G4_ROMCU
MFESLAAWVLNSYIGDYLEKLNTDQLSLDLFQGQLELEDVPFKKNALRKFGVLIDIRSGIIGKLTLNVPLTRLRSDSWIITLSNVFLVLEPASCSSNMVLDASKEETLSHEVVNDLKLIAVQERATVDTSSSPRTTDATSSWWDYYGISTIIDNIKLILNNVHIRYEHKSGSNITLNPFAAGCRIDRLCFQSTDFQWIPTFVVRSLSQDYYKSVIFDGLSIYWDCDETYRRAETYQDLKDLMKDCCGREPEIELEYDFVDVNSGDDKVPETKIDTDSKLSWLLDRASGAIHAQIKSSDAQNPDASTCLDFDVIINDSMRLSLEQIHYDHLLTLVRSFKEDYELEFDRNSHKNKAKVRRKSDNNEKQNTELDKTKSNAVQWLISIQIPRLLLALKNYLTTNNKEDKSFVSLKAENLLVRYNGEESDLTSMEIIASKFQIIDSFQEFSMSLSSAYLLNVFRSSCEVEDRTNNTVNLSASCPELTSAINGHWFKPITSSSSVQNTSLIHTDLSNSMFDDSSKRTSRKISSRFEKNFDVKIVSVHRKHPKFLSQYNESVLSVSVVEEVRPSIAFAEPKTIDL